MTEIVIGVDVGSSSVKAAAYDHGGRVVGNGRIPTPSVVGPFGVDFPVPAVVEAARTAAREAARGRAIAGVGLTSMGEVGAVLTAGGAWSGTAFPAWHDDRGADVASRLTEQSPLVNGRSGGHVRATSSLAKLAWLAGTGHDLDGCFLGLCGLLAERWTGARWQEASLAATSGAYDPVTGEWLTDLWSAAGLDHVRLPEVFPAGAGVRARGRTAEQDGLGGALIVIAGHDHPVAAVGTGSSAGDVVDSLGTGEPVLAAWAAPPPAAEVSDLVERGFTVETWPSTGDPLLIWEGLRPGLAMDAVIGASGRSRDELESAVWDAGVRPFSRDEARALERGDTTPLGRRDLSPESALSTWRAAWTDLLHAYARDAAVGEQEIRRATAASGPLVLTGGGLRSSLWLAAKRAATSSPIRVAALADSGARGAAAITGATLEWWPDAASMPLEDNE